MKTIIFDADMLLFVACLGAEKPIEWEEGLWTLHCDFNEATTAFSSLTADLIAKVLDHYKYTGKYEIKMCLTDTDNFRKDILPEYKGNRKGSRRPVCFNPMREWIAKTYPTTMEPRLEADDCIGLSLTDDCIIISGDKDMRCLPAPFFDFLRNEYFETTPEEADYWHYYQTILGDTADHYKGAVGFGAVKTKKLLDQYGAKWSTVLKAFKGDVETALVSAQVAHILRKGDYNWNTKEITLWKPPIDQLD